MPTLRTIASTLTTCLLVAGCGGGGSESGSADEATSSSSGSEATAGESASESASGSETTAGSEATAGESAETTLDETAETTLDETTMGETGEPVCGNGAVEGDEQCDQGLENLETGECLPDCTFNVCGDTFVGPAEGCDDGNILDGDGCSALCLIEDLEPGVVMCGNKVYECGDLIDNDMDGAVDLDDPECISPCDDDESSFQTDLPGQNNDCKQDCYFDANSGGGDDSCEWNLQCDPANPGADVGCPYDPDFAMCELDMMQACLDFCTPLVPNGCDCFGCCEIEGQFVYLDSGNGCALDNLAACQACTFFENCNNPCVPEDCELCFGQDPADLPEDCEMAACPEGVTSCESIDDCPIGQYCQTGCCIDIQPQ